MEPEALLTPGVILFGRELLDPVAIYARVGSSALLHWMLIPPECRIAALFFVVHCARGYATLGYYSFAYAAPRVCLH